MNRLPGRPLVWLSLPCMTAILGVLALGATLSPSRAPARVAAAAQSPTQDADAPPYPYSIVARTGPWGFPTRFAGDYVAWRLYERDVAFSSDLAGPSGRKGHFGVPATWATTAAGIGFRVDDVPQPGAIAQWRAGEQGAGPAGHVAYVDRVNPDGSVVISEFDWNVKNGYSARAARAPRYIHVRDL